MLIQACLNGARSNDYHPRLPVDPDTLAAEAVSAVMAGAGELHLHVRGAEGRESLAPEHVDATLLVLRSRLTQMVGETIVQRSPPGQQAVGTALTDERRARKSFEKFIEGRQGAPLTSAVRAVAGDTGIPEYRAHELLTAQFVVVGPNIFNRRR